MLAPPHFGEIHLGPRKPLNGTWYLPVTVGEDARYRKDWGIMFVVMEARRAIEGVLTTA